MTKALNSIVSKTEADALKDMIFKRARERAESINTESNETITSSVYNDVMTMARYAFVTPKNPFNQDVQKPLPNQQVSKVEPQSNTEIEDISSNDVVGFPKREVREIKSKITMSTKELVSKHLEESMQDAHNDFMKKTSFVGALNFLNQQASVNLLSKNGSKFEAVA